MAVVARKRKSGTVYCAVNQWRGRQVSELIGPSRREAETRDRAMKREIASGAYEPPASRKVLTLGEYCRIWEKGRSNASAPDELRLLRLHVHPREWLSEKRLDEVRPSDVAKWVEELKRERKNGERRLSDKTIANAVGVLRQVFNQALREERCVRQPVVLAPKTLKKSVGREPEIYTPAEMLVLTRHHKIPWPVRVLNALCLFTGMREGEACGRRWRDLSDDSTPLPCLIVRDQYNSRPLKTERPRAVPVHPELARILTDWAREGFELYAMRPPEPDDFIVPNMGRRAQLLGGHHTRSSYYKAFIKYAEAAGVRARTLHSTRHSFITHCRRGGARADVLERVTHNAAGKIIDRYTHFDWAPLCEAVLCLRLDAHPTALPYNGTGGNTGSVRSSLGVTSAADSPQLGATDPASIPGASTHKSLLLQSARKTRQEKRQAKAGVPEELRAANRIRKRRLLSLQEADPDQARPGLALCRALDAVYDGDIESAQAELERAAGALGVA